MKDLTRALKPSFFYLAVLFLALGSSGCIEIMEKLQINPDQSGKYSLEIDGGQLAGLLMLTGGGESSEVRALMVSLRDIERKLSGREGISQVKVDTNLNDGKVSFSFLFSDQRSLNNAMFALADIDKKFFHPKLYKVNKRKVKRKNIAPFLRMYIEREYPELTENQLLKKIHLSSECTLPGKAESKRGPVYRHRTDTMTYRWNAWSMLNSKESLGFKLKYELPE